MTGYENGTIQKETIENGAMGIRKLKQNRTSKRIGYSAAASLLLISPSMLGVSRVWAATTWSATDLTGSGSFTQPFAVAVDGSGNVFVTNQGSSSPAVEELQNGTWTDLTLSGGGSFNAPSGIAVDSHGNVFVTNENNTAVPSVEELSGGTWTDITHGGTFTQPYGVAVDSAGDVFVTDATANKIKELPHGQTTWTDITGTGSFNQPEGIAVDSAGDVFVTNNGNGTIEELVGGPGGTWTDITGTGGNFSNPVGITVDGSGDLFVADYGTNALEERQSGSSTWTALSGNGVFMSPAGIAVDGAGNLYVADNAASTGSSGGGGGIGGLPGGGGGAGGSGAVIKYTPSLTAPAQPSGLVASNTTATGTTLKWTATATATTYNVYQGAVQIAHNLTSPTYTITGLTPSTAYSFTVSAVNAAGESPQSSSVAVNTLATAPTAPTGLVAKGTTSTGTTLSWTAPAGATSFNVYQTGNTTPIATGVTSTNYTVTGLTAGHSYSFKVTAVNSGGESAPGNTVAVNTLNTGSISLTFGSTSVQSGASQTVTGVVYDNNAPMPNAVVNLSSTIGYWGTSGTNSSETVTADVYGSFSTTWTAPTVSATTAGTVSATVTGFVYGVTPTTVSISVSPPPIVAPGAPTGLAASGTSTTSTKLTWHAVSGATSYNLYENNSSTPMKTGITGTSYTVSGLTSGATYSFKVSAVNAGGESAKSSAATVTTTVVTPPPAPTLSSNTAIVDRPIDSQKFVWSIDSTNPSASVSVVSGSTVVDVLGAIQSTDGSVQTYKVQDGNQTINGTTVLKDGDVLVVTAADGKTTARYTISTWMEVSTAAQLEQIDKNQSNYLKANIKLMNDIDLTGYRWVPLGNSNDFTGTFDGQGHQVTGVSIQDAIDINGGFFGSVNGTIENVGVDATVSGSGGEIIGGLVGRQNGGSISDSYATGSESGGDASQVGGLVGLQVGGSISDSYATGSVSSANYSGSAGGLVGLQYAGSISDSYATGSVSGGLLTHAGGLVGRHNSGSTSDSYFDTQTTKQGTSAGGTGESTAAMQTQSTYSGWDFTKTWGISPSVNGGYPYLRVFTPQASTSAASNTQIADKPSDSQKYVWSVDNSKGLLSVSVVNGSTASQLTGAIEATDGSTQTYAVQRAGQTVSGTTALKDGDVLVVTAADGKTTADYTVSTWMEVSTAAQLEQIDKNQGNYLKANIKLMNDIDLTGYSGWMPIVFAGTFDGQGHEITGLSINAAVGSDVGFFGLTTGTIEHLGVDAKVVAGANARAGVLAGEQVGGSISDSYATGSVSQSSGGDLLGQASSNLGGLVGYEMSGSISNSYATAVVTGSQSSGGDPFNTQPSVVGGLVGYQNGIITDSYATGKVTGATTGGLVGTGAHLSGSYFDKDTTGQSSGGQATGSSLVLDFGGSLTGVTGESDSAMKKQSTFQGWDFTKTWAISPTLNGGYPYLRAFTPKASAANDTQIQDKKSDSQKYVWSVDNTNGLLSVSVVNGSTAAQLTGAIEATDGSAQTYVVQRAGQTISGNTALKDGDVLVVTSADGTVTAHYTVSTWMEVSTAAQLEQIDKNQGNYLNANIRLMNDIDLTGYSWTPVGGNNYGAFTGTLDGQGHKMTGLSVGLLPPTAKDFGFFGETSGTIENVGVAANMTVTGEFTGIFAGEQDGGSIKNSYGSGTVSFVGVFGGNSATGTVGGLVGMQNSGRINASYATASVTATTGGGLVGEQKGGSINGSYATASVSATTGGGLATTGGGLVGEQKGGSINASYASGPVKGMSALNTFMGYYVSGAPSIAGGLVGSQTGGSISDSYATGTVSGDGPGGLVGSQTGGSISSSYATGAVVASLYAQGSALSQFPTGVGGLVGYESEATITSSYFDKDKTGQSNGVGKSTSSTQSPPTGFTGATDSAMKTQSTFQGWDFTKTWAMSTSVNGGYPYLREIALPTSTASQTFDAAGGSSQHQFGNETVSVNVPAGAFATDETVKVSLVPASNVTESMQGLSKSKVAAVLDVSFSGASPTKPVTVTITNSSIQAGGVVYKKTSDGKLVPLKATVVNGKATVSFTSDPTFVVLNLSQNERVITMTGHASVVPGLSQAESAHGNKTTYMPIWYVMQLLKPLGIQSTWNGEVWHLTTPSQPNLSSIVVGHGRTSIYLNGTLVQKVDAVAAKDPSTGKNTAYMPIWYVMQLLKRVGLQSTWDGTTWTVTK